MIVTVAVLLLPQTSELHPRTLVVWPEDTPCMTVVDRSQSTLLHFAYEIPYEDTMVPPPPMEVADSRRHQFAAFCRGHSRQTPLPTWLSWADVAAAGEFGLVPGELGDADVLETSSEWAPCFHRITADDERRPITFAEAAKGVDWDTASLPAGAYVIEGYTWEPGFNLWQVRPGVVHVVDGPGLDVMPAAAVMTRDDFMFADASLQLEGCARALPGSTLSLWWSIADGDELDWQLASSGTPLMGEAFALTFHPPPEATGENVALRVDVTDPAQRTFAAHPLQLVVVLPAQDDGPGECGSLLGCDDDTTTADPETGPDAGSGGSEAPSTSSDGPVPGGSPDSSESSGPPMEDSGLGSRGCACGVDGAPAPAALGLFALVGLAARRRRDTRECP
ncbi:MYXO-CTERM sorting domain-containing protein [Nannocystis sp. SCPEA4]|uniref:MYXO-CTERM sorting domain-containing protein n=1 Tax=Nannocystis sp. SCPEA4 TaxID=2996787 RepID=UPI0022710AE6|nr:MYXO-CTERM sorting domain-containing protein [Nannocystis sp. SCPEA4]